MAVGEENSYVCRIALFESSCIMVMMLEAIAPLTCLRPATHCSPLRYLMLDLNNIHRSQMSRGFVDLQTPLAHSRDLWAVIEKPR
jgi:hypothetical protein